MQYNNLIAIETITSEGKMFFVSDSMALEPAERLEDVTHLAGLCIEVLQQNEEHHSEVG